MWHWDRLVGLVLGGAVALAVSSPALAQESLPAVQVPSAPTSVEVQEEKVGETGKVEKDDKTEKVEKNPVEDDKKGTPEGETSPETEKKDVTGADKPVAKPRLAPQPKSKAPAPKQVEKKTTDTKTTSAKTTDTKAANTKTTDTKAATNKPASQKAPTTPQEQMDALAQANKSSLVDGEYLVRSDLGASKVLDVSGGSKVNGGNVQTYTANMTGAQRWVVSHDKKGYVVLTNRGSGKVLDVTAGAAKSGTNVQQYTSNGTKAQRWIVVASGGAFNVISALSASPSSQLVLDVSGASTANGANVQIYRKNGTKAQLFSFYSTSPTVATSTYTNVDQAAYYTITSALSGSMVVDVAACSHDTGANVQVYAKNGTPAQLYHLKSNGGGYYRVECAGTGKVLEVKGGCPLPGTNVQQAGWSSSKSQLFSLAQNSDGTVRLTNAASGLVLDVAGGRSASGTNLQGYAANGTKAQAFRLTKVTDLLNIGLQELAPSYALGKRLDVAAASTAKGANVQLWDGNGTLAQKWNVVLVKAGTNSYRLQGVCSGRYLTTSGSNVVQGDADAGSVWVPSYAGGWLVLANQRSGKVLDISGRGTGNGTNVQVYKSNGTVAQRFKMSSTSPLANGCYVVRFASNGGQVLDVSGGSTSDCANVQSYASNGTGAQKWYLECRGGDTYALRNAQSNRYLDVSSGKGVNGQNVWQYHGNGSAAQGWRLVYTGGAGTFKLVSRTNGSVVLSTAGASAPRSGANVVVATDASSANQRFTFAPTTYNPVPAWQRALVDRANRYGSATGRLVLVDTGASRVYAFSGRQGSWRYDRTMVCSAGKPSTPTVKGQFTVQNKGYVFGHGYSCYYWTQFHGNYLFHSVLYYQGSRRIMDGTLGHNASHGCVRMAIDDAKWIQDTMPRGTKVVVY